MRLRQPRCLKASPFLALALLAFSSTPARAVLCASSSLSLHYVPGTGTSTGAQSCSDSFRCHEAKQPAAPYFLKVNPSCDPNLQGCLVQLRVPLAVTVGSEVTSAGGAGL